MSKYQTMNRYKRPAYSEETYRQWAESEKKAKEFAEKHTQETIKVIPQNGGYFIKCIQKKIRCMYEERKRIWCTGICGKSRNLSSR